MLTTSLDQIRVGVLVQRLRARSAWADVLWRPASVLAGVPAAAPWTPIACAGETTTFYAGDAVIELHRADAEQYRDNLISGRPLLWVVLRRVPAAPGLALLSVTGDPATGEALTGAGDDIVDTVSMPALIRDRFAAFIAEHYVHRPIYRRERDRVGNP